MSSALSPIELRSIRDSVFAGLATSSILNSCGPSQIVARLDTEQQGASSHSIPGEALATNGLSSLLDPIVIGSMTDANIAEYAWLALQDDLKSSINQNNDPRNNVDLTATTVAPVDVRPSQSEISLASRPFLLDNTCTAHISPDRSDFLFLRPIANRVVRGFCGTNLRAIGIGSIKLITGKGAHIILNNVVHPFVYRPVDLGYSYHRHVTMHCII